MNTPRNSDYIRIQIFGVILLLPKILEFLDSCLNLSSPVVTVGLYIGVLVFSVLKCKTIKIADFVVLILVYALFAFNYIFFKIAREYMREQDMLLIYFFFIPTGIFIFKNIKSWDGYEKILYPFSVIAVLLNTLVFVSEGRNMLSYMEVSYSLLPFIALLYTCARTYRRKRMKSLIIFAVGTIETFAFGARGPILFLMIFIFFYEMLRIDAAFYKKALIVVIGIVLITLVSIYSNSIVESLSKIKIFENSYILQNLLSGDFLRHKTRTLISQQCIKRIESMGLEISGMFGDRVYCGSIYPHNIVYELLMSFGWIFGIATLGFLFILMLRALLNKEKRIVAVFLITTLFLRFFVSGSYIIEGRFWVFLFALLSLNQQEKKEGTIGEIKL